MGNNEITFKIEKNYGVLSTSKSGWTKEVNKISWNGTTAKWDIRDWSPDHSKMGKGVTLTDTEMEVLIKAVGTKDSSGEEIVF